MLDACRARPSPLTFFDATIHMAPPWSCGARARPSSTTNFFSRRSSSASQTAWRRWTAKHSGSTGTGCRCGGSSRTWPASWRRPGPVVASTYCNAWIFDALDPADPFESMARAYLELFISRSDEAKEQVHARLCRRFRVDGVLFHEAKTCPNNSNTRYGLPQTAKGSHGPPLADDLRGPERPALLLRGAGEDQHRGLPGADRARGSPGERLQPLPGGGHRLHLGQGRRRGRGRRTGRRARPRAHGHELRGGGAGCARPWPRAGLASVAAPVPWRPATGGETPPSPTRGAPRSPATRGAPTTTSRRCATWWTSAARTTRSSTSGPTAPWRTS